MIISHELFRKSKQQIWKKLKKRETKSLNFPTGIALFSKKLLAGKDDLINKLNALTYFEIFMESFNMMPAI